MQQPGPGTESIPGELQYVALLFVLFVLPRVLQRYRLPSAITCVALGAIAGIGFGLFQHDAAVSLLSTLGIVSLFLFAGLDVEFDDLRRNAAVLAQHVGIRVSLLAVVTLGVQTTLGLAVQPAILVALALTTPSTGFILDSLNSLGVNPQERVWINRRRLPRNSLHSACCSSPCNRRASRASRGRRWCSS